MTRSLLAFGGLALCLYAAVCAGLFVFQRALIYLPMDMPGTPSRHGVPEMRAVAARSADGLALAGWFAPPRAPGTPVVVLFHGNAGNLASRSFKARAFLDAGLGVMLAGYRGYGGNPGAPSEEGLFADGRAALDFLAAQGIEAGDVVLYGESLGSGVAVRMASERRVAAVILEAPYTSLPDVASFHYPFVPVGWLARDRFDSVSRIAAIAAPLLVVHGDRDEVIPIALGQRLFAAAAEPKRAQWIAGGSHNDLWERIRAAVIAFAAARGR